MVKEKEREPKQKKSINCSLLCDKRDILGFHILPPLGLCLDLGFVEGFAGETEDAWTR